MTWCPLIVKLGLVSDMNKIGVEWSKISAKLKNISERNSVKSHFISVSQNAEFILMLESSFFNKVLDNFS